MALINLHHLNQARIFIYSNGRLLERLLFELFFGNGTAEACLQALRAYQNPDGGFGNGLEPDLLCPYSSAIGAETALSVLDLMGSLPADIVNPLVQWIASQQNQAGYIDHPPHNYSNYPYQSWWKNPDNTRILSLAGFLRKWGVECPEIYAKASAFSKTVPIPPELAFYDYPFFIYYKYCSIDEDDRSRLERMINLLPVLLDKFSDHTPLFTKSWDEAIPFVPPEVRMAQAAAFVQTIQPDGGAKSAYPQYPWWRPIVTLDGFILLKKWGYSP